MGVFETVPQKQRQALWFPTLNQIDKRTPRSERISSLFIFIELRQGLSVSWRNFQFTTYPRRVAAAFSTTQTVSNSKFLAYRVRIVAVQFINREIVIAREQRPIGAVRKKLQGPGSAFRFILSHVVDKTSLKRKHRTRPCEGELRVGSMTVSLL